MLRNDEKRYQYDRTYKSNEDKNFKYDKNEDPNAFKYDYKKAREDKYHSKSSLLSKFCDHFIRTINESFVSWNHHYL